MNFDAQGFGDSAIAWLVTFVPKLVGVFALIFVAWLIAGALGKAVRKGLERSKFDPTLTKFFANLTRYAILIMALLACLGVFGVQTTSFAAVIGAAGLAIGLAFQGTLANFSAGVMLLVFRPFKVGDLISVNGFTGIVQEIELFTTQLDTLDNRRIIVPNGSIFGTTIENITYHPIRRVDVNVGTDYGVDLNKVREVLERTADKVNGRIDTHPPQVFLSELGDSSINWQLRVWCNTPEYWDVWQALTRDIKADLDAAGIGIPFPQMDVHLDGALESQG